MVSVIGKPWDLHDGNDYKGFNYRKISNIRRTLVGNEIVDHSDVVGASPVGAAPTTSLFSTWHLASRDSAKTGARQSENLLSVGNGGSYIRDLTVLAIARNWLKWFSSMDCWSHTRAIEPSIAIAPVHLQIYNFVLFCCVWVWCRPLQLHSIVIYNTLLATS